MNKLILLSSLFLFSFYKSSDNTYWGDIGHEVVGHIAEEMLTENAQKSVKRILGEESLADVSNWMDQVRFHPRFAHTATWHYCPIPMGMTYESIEKQEGGDVIWALEKTIGELKKGGLTPEQEAVNLKFLIHMVGDVHQPLHVGKDEDRGGTDVKVNWFGEATNLHSVWDNKMIESTQLSYTEFVENLVQPTQEQVRLWQTATVRDWAMESMSYRNRVYELPKNNNLDDEYLNRNLEIIELRIMQAGVRLAGVLNDIYK